MTVLKKKEIESIAKTISEHFNEYTTKYESEKYPEEPYMKWLSVFPKPKMADINDVRQAMEWKYGHWGKANYVSAHKVIIAKLQKYWPEFAESGQYDLDSTFAFWEERLAGHQSFITVAFLSHLINPEQVEIIDQHNFRAMNYFISTVREDWVWKRNPMSIEDIVAFSAFLRMPLYKNGSINSLMNKRYLSLREIITYSLEFLSGVHYIHTKGLLQFDIKPTNILISDSNTALLTDFGLAKYINQYGFAIPDLLYPPHRAPESYNVGSLDVYHDIYHCGLTIYRMCNGNAEFANQLSTATFQYRLHFDPPVHVPKSQAILGKLPRIA